MGVIGYHINAGQHVPDAQDLDLKLRHTYVVGGSGMGKSTLLANMIAQDMDAGLGVGVIDPKGDLAERVLSLVPAHRKNDVVYFDATDFERPVGFNPLDSIPPTDVHAVAEGLVYALRSIFPSTFGPSRMQYLLLSAALPVIEDYGNTILSVQRFIADKIFRARVLNDTTNPVTKWYWHKVFDEYQDRLKEENTAPIGNPPKN